MKEGCKMYGTAIFDKTLADIFNTNKWMALRLPGCESSVFRLIATLISDRSWMQEYARG
jgi:hypothetical protein